MWKDKRWCVAEAVSDLGRRRWEVGLDSGLTESGMASRILMMWTMQAVCGKMDRNVVEGTVLVSVKLEKACVGGRG